MRAKWRKCSKRYRDKKRQAEKSGASLVKNDTSGNYEINAAVEKRRQQWKDGKNENPKIAWSRLQYFSSTVRKSINRVFRIQFIFILKAVFFNGLTAISHLLLLQQLPEKYIELSKHIIFYSLYYWHGFIMDQ